VMIKNPGSQFAGIGTAKPPGVGELQSNEEIIHRTEILVMYLPQGVKERLNSGLVLFTDHKLVRIRPSIMAHRHRFSAEDHLCTGHAKMPPAAQGELRRHSFGS